MEPIRVLDLGLVPAVRSQSVYHAVAHTFGPHTPDTLILVAPERPYVCIGYHQDIDAEVDRDYCREHGLPVYKREVGGGAVYLDRHQVFVQWVFAPDHLPADLPGQFDLFARPLVDTYRSLGIEAYLRPINDIHVSGKKIGGTGAAQIGGARVLVGSLMFDFDKETMSKVLKVSSEKMRDKVFQGLTDYMTTMREQLGEPADRDATVSRYLAACEEALGAPVVAGELAEEELALADELDTRLASEEFLGIRGRAPVGVKIHQDVRVVEGALKAPGGLVRVTARLREDRVDDVTFSGDFTLLPADGVTAIEEALRGCAVSQEELTARVESVYLDRALESPGLAPADFARVLVAAAGPAA
ncbi:MAG: lipoate--protein ligase [Nocardioides sp.]